MTRQHEDSEAGGRARGIAGLVVILGVGALLLFATVRTVHAVRSPGARIVVASKAFSESWILAELYAQRIERVTGESVMRRHALGGTLLAFEGLRGGGIDVYPEYTGTGFVSILRRAPPRDPDEVLPAVREEFAERWGMTWLDPHGFNNTYALAVTRAKAQALGLRRISDLAAHPELSAGFATEFVARDDGWPGLSERYGLTLDAEPRAMEAGLMYQAAADGEVDLISAYSTDARIDKLDLVLLDDDRSFFPPYHAAPLVGPGVLTRHPEIADALAPLADRFDDAAMRRLNAEVDIEHRDPADVARDWLDEQGL